MAPPIGLGLGNALCLGGGSVESIPANYNALAMDNEIILMDTETVTMD